MLWKYWLSTASTLAIFEATGPIKPGKWISPTVVMDRTWTDISAEADLSLEVFYRMLPVLEKQGEIRDTSDTVVLLDRSTRPRSPATKKSI